MAGSAKTYARRRRLLTSAAVLALLWPAFDRPPARAGSVTSSSMPITLPGGTTNFDTGRGIVTLSGVISGPGNLEVYGDGWLTLTGTNTYTGYTSIGGGTWRPGDRPWLGGGGYLLIGSDANLGAPGGMLYVGSTGRLQTTDSFATSRNIYIANGGMLVQDAGTTLTLSGVITDGSTLTKGGPGTLVLTGANTYSGGTIIDRAGGTLQIGPGGSIIGNVYIMAGGTLEFNSPYDQTYAGIVFGRPGDIVKRGTGTLTVTSSLFVDHVTVAEGTLRMGAGSFFADRITNNAVLQYSQPGRIRVYGEISGTGSVTLTGGGTTVMLRDNTYTGVTTIDNATLTFGDGGSEGSVVGDIVNNGRLVIDRSWDPFTLSSAISGSGSLTRTAYGTLILTGDSTYTGGTTIAGGTLRIGNGGSTGSIVGDIANNGTLVIDRSGSITLPGAISGSGSLTKTGPGTLILTGDSTYTGGTTIAQGTLQIGNGGGTGSIQGNIVNNARLVFNRSGTYQFPTALSGSGTVSILGGGTASFTGTGGGFTGTISIAGTNFVLARGAVSPASYTIDAGATISGIGTIANLTVTSGGTAAPGYSPGTLTVTGNVAFQPGSVYSVDMTAAGDHDLITATGSATLTGGTVAVNAATGNYGATTSRTILHADGGVNGTFTTATSNLAFLTPVLSYGANDVVLTLNRNAATFASLTATANQGAAATAAETLGTARPLNGALTGLTPDAVPAAFDALSGEAYASTGAILLSQSSHLRDAVGARLGQALEAGSAADGGAAASGATAAPLAPGFAPTVWFQGFGAWGNVFGNGNAATVRTGIAGGFGGTDVALDETWHLGIVGGYSRSTLKVPARSTSGTIDNYDLGAYLGGRFGAVGLKAGVTHTWHDIAMRRTVAFPGFSEANNAGYRAATTQVFGEASYTARFDRLSVEPFAGLAYVHVGAGGATESGVDAALAIAPRDTDTVFSSLGLRLGGRFDPMPYLSITPSLSFAWVHAFGDVAPAATASFASGSRPFAVAGAPFARDSAQIGAGIDVGLGDSATFSATYGGQFGRGLQENTFRGRLTLRF